MIMNDNYKDDEIPETLSIAVLIIVFVLSIILEWI
jgi:hypothetical protein